MLKLDIIIPVYNEDKNIVRLLQSLENEITCNFRVLICYDSETDTTLKYNQGFKIGCFTASSKGNTLLNCLNLNKQIIQFASENNIKKIGKYTPGTYIKIISDNDFCNKKIDYAILLSWNYKKFFLSKSRFIKKGGKFIVPLPVPHIK